MPWKNTPATRQKSNTTYGNTWRKARKAHLAAHPTCQIQLPGCTTTATETDHIIGAANDPQHRHLRSACKPCHAKVTAQQGGGYRKTRTADPAPRPTTAW